VTQTLSTYKAELPSGSFVYIVALDEQDARSRLRADTDNALQQQITDYYGAN